MNYIKMCSKCGMSKPLDEFNKDKHRKDGRYPQCKDCTRKNYIDNREKRLYKNREYYLNNRNVIIKRCERYRKNNKKAILDKDKKRYENNREKILKRVNEYRINNKELIVNKKKKYYKKNKEKIKEYKNGYRDKNKKRIIEYSKEYYQNNREEMKDKSKEYLKTNAGKITNTKHNAKRERELGYIPLNNRFEGCEGHHVDNERVIFIPSEMHRSNPHRQSDPNTMIEINKLAFNYLNNITNV